VHHIKGAASASLIMGRGYFCLSRVTSMVLEANAPKLVKGNLQWVTPTIDTGLP
jgi:hypothetical protein